MQNPCLLPAGMAACHLFTYYAVKVLKGNEKLRSMVAGRTNGAAMPVVLTMVNYPQHNNSGCINSVTCIERMMEGRNDEGKAMMN